MILLIVGKGLHAHYIKGHFVTSLMNGHVKMSFAIGRAEPFCACMAHKRVGAALQVSVWLWWVVGMPMLSMAPVGYVRRHPWRLKRQPGFGRGPGRFFLRSRKGLSFGLIWRPFRGL